MQVKRFAIAQKMFLKTSYFVRFCVYLCEKSKVGEAGFLYSTEVLIVQDS